MDRLTSLIAKVERSAMRRLPPAMVVRGNARLHRWIGEPELRLVGEFVKPGTVAVDVGGHFGAYTVTMARHVQPGGRVITVEPIEEDASMIEDATRRLKLPVDVLHCALSDSVGEADLSVPRIGGSEKTALSTLEHRSQSGTIAKGDVRRVLTRTLDDVLADVTQPLSFVKVDVEGHELALLRGAERTLNDRRPIWLIEVNDDLGDRPASDVFELFLKAGYQGEFLEGGKHRMPLQAFDVERHQRSAAANVLSRAFVNNFVFRPAS